MNKVRHEKEPETMLYKFGEEAVKRPGSEEDELRDMRYFVRCALPIPGTLPVRFPFRRQTQSQRIYGAPIKSIAH